MIFRAMIASLVLATLVHPSAAKAQLADSVKLVRIATDAETAEMIAAPLANGFIRTLTDDADVVLAPALDVSGSNMTWRAIVTTSSGDLLVVLLKEASDPFALVENGLAEIVISSRSPSDTLEFWQRDGISAATLGLRAVALFAHSGGPQSLNLEEVRAVLAGESAWPVGVVRSLSGGVPLSTPGQDADILPIAGAQLFETERDLGGWVRRERSRIGVASASGQVMDYAIPVGDCRRGFTPGFIEVATREYPLTREVAAFFVATSGGIADPDLVQRFSRFLRLPQSEEILLAQGIEADAIFEINDRAYIARKAEYLRSTPSAASQLETFVEFLETGRQISRVTRFEYNSDRLSALAQSDVTEIARFLEERIRNRSVERVAIAGFADPYGGNGPENQQLSERRAEAVARALRRDPSLGALLRSADAPEIAVLGLGASLYLGCPEGGESDRLSRRVEIWLD